MAPPRSREQDRREAAIDGEFEAADNSAVSVFRRTQSFVLPRHQVMEGAEGFAKRYFTAARGTGSSRRIGVGFPSRLSVTR